ncbi:SDR family oxidoreductase [Actinoplanes couchii]|uniref:Thioester reductase (TE) domain-containing protein n=1 Tax=Actinoplanes couchii TaxID=403638 RepID=A0ABQ3XF71_9ACTN|nr:SDR family oxidoreductase [Actinoplanes couchii]MDR6319939.1 thioester reductase-like protein [Actinoplanes couchii]GID57075.1 hypothetical protein Aco03nite_054790 [Actinoplanes couchii]
MTVHVVTGATGLVGAALVLELLARTGADVVCPVRPGRTDAATRLTAALTGAARAYGADERLIARCRAVPADLTRELCGVDPAAVGPVDEFWHCAADLRYEDRHRELLFDTNVTGTRHARELARALGATVFNYVSTAYVAGRRTGLLREEPAPAGLGNNHYEESKTAAEHLLSESDEPMVRVLRPSIVIGHSTTMAVAGGRTGLYTIHRRVFQLDRMLTLIGDTDGRERPLRIRADEDSRINVVPVDLVAADAVTLSEAAAPAGVYHLTHPAPMRLRPGLDLMFAMSGLPAPLLVGDDDGFQQIDREFDRRLDFHRSYMTGQKTFEQGNLRAVAPGARLLSWTIDLPTLERLYGWHLDQLSARATVRAAVR